MIEKILIKLIEQGRFKIAKKIIKKHCECVGSQREKEIFKGDTGSNIVAHFCIIYAKIYKRKNIIFTIVENSLDDSINIEYDKIEG